MNDTKKDAGIERLHMRDSQEAVRYIDAYPMISEDGVPGAHAEELGIASREQERAFKENLKANWGLPLSEHQRIVEYRQEDGVLVLLKGNLQEGRFTVTDMLVANAGGDDDKAIVRLLTKHFVPLPYPIVFSAAQASEPFDFGREIILPNVEDAHQLHRAVQDAAHFLRKQEERCRHQGSDVALAAPITLQTLPFPPLAAKRRTV